MTGSRFLFLIQRLILMVGGEAIQSAFHFALNIFLLHVLSAHDYGIFAISMVMGGVGLAYIRSFTAIPATIWIAGSKTKIQANAYDVTFGSAALLLSTCMMLIAALLLHLWGSDGALAGGCFIGLWSLRSHLRTAFFARQRQWIVSCSDACFTLAGLVSTAFVLYRGDNVLRGVFEALSVANGCGIFVLLALARQRIRISVRAAIRKRYLGLWPQLRWSVFYITTSLLQGQCVALLVTVMAGPAAYAPIAAVLTLFAPLRIIATAFDNMMQPEMSASLARGEREKIWSQAQIWSLVMGMGGLAYGGIVLAVTPYIESEALIDASIHFIGIFAWIIFSLIMLYSMPRIILEIMNDFWILAMINMAGAVVGLVSIAALLTFASPPWSLAGAALSEAIFLLVCWITVRRRLKIGFQPFRA